MGDRRLEAAMPGHSRATVVQGVTVKKSFPMEKIEDHAPELADILQEGGKYVLWQIKFAKVCLLSAHRVIDDEAYEALAGSPSPLKNCLKLIVTPVNLVVNLPAKSPKDSDTVQDFFGVSNTHFSRKRIDRLKCDVTLVSVDAYGVWSLRMLLPSVAFKVGRIVDFHLVSYRDNTSFVSYRCAMMDELIQSIKKLGG